MSHDPLNHAGEIKAAYARIVYLESILRVIRQALVEDDVQDLFVMALLNQALGEE